MRAFASALHGFLDTIRQGHADTPIILISPVFCPFSENVPGPTSASIKEVEGRERLVFEAIQGHEEVRRNSLTLSQDAHNRWDQPGRRFHGRLLLVYIAVTDFVHVTVSKLI